MLPRTKSIFHLEEEAAGGGVEAISRSEVHGGLRRVSDQGLVGLRILIQHPVRGPNNIVVKTNKFCADHNSGSFLKSCFLCRRELSPNKDVYMYKGDQGFCSVECRYNQMVVDERREFEEYSARDRRLRMLAHSHANHHHHHPISKIRDSDASRRRRRVLATAA